MSPKEVKGCVKVTHLVDGGAQAQSRPPDPRTLGFFLTVLHCCLSRHMPKVSHHCYQNQFCSLSLGRRSVRPQTTGGTFPDLSPSWCFQGSVLCPATAHQLPSAQAKQVPFKVEQQKSCCLPADSLDGETSQGSCQISYPLASSTH